VNNKLKCCMHLHLHQIVIVLPVWLKRSIQNDVLQENVKIVSNVTTAYIISNWFKVIQIWIDCDCPFTMYSVHSTQYHFSTMLHPYSNNPELPTSRGSVTIALTHCESCSNSSDSAMISEVGTRKSHIKEQLPNSNIWLRIFHTITSQPTQRPWFTTQESGKKIDTSFTVILRTPFTKFVIRTHKIKTWPNTTNKWWAVYGKLLSSHLYTVNKWPPKNTWG